MYDDIVLATAMSAAPIRASLVMRDQGVIVLACQQCGHMQTEDDIPGLVGYPCDGCGANVTIMWPGGLNYPRTGKDTDD